MEEAPWTQKFRCDLEKAPALEFMKKFPNAHVETCMFQLAQANWRKTQSFGLATKYLEDMEMKVLMKSFTALAFVPPEHLVETFACLREHVQNDDCLLPLVEYFESTYVAKWESRPHPDDPARLQVRWKKPQYSPKLWSVYHRVLQGEPRTTCMLEAWHRRFGILVNKSHPSIWHLLKHLQDEQIHTESTILNLVAGQAPKGPRKDQVRKNIRLCTIVSSYEERRENIMDYLKGCTYNFDF